MGSTRVFVSTFPPCDVCGEEAHYDAKTWEGSWMKLCDEHFRELGIGLGAGRGQKLELSSDRFERGVGRIVKGFTADDVERALEQAVVDGLVECYNCGESMESDAKKCSYCGAPNPMADYI